MADRVDVILTTERLLLKRLEKSDIPFLVDLWSDPEVTYYMGGPRKKEYLQKTFENDLTQNYDYDLWPLYNRISHEFVGHCGFIPKDIDGKTEIEMNYIISKKEWGKGYATEIALALKHFAFEIMKLVKVIAFIDPKNFQSIKLQKRLE